MKRLANLGMLIAIASGVAALAQSPLAGTWKSTQNGLPVVDLTIRNDGGKVSGTTLFYLLMHDADASGSHVGGEMSAPMENIKTTGNTLTFDVHRKDGSVVSFRVELRPDGHAKLFRIGDDESNGRPGPPKDGLDLVRQQ